jgi:hypothetical protein
MPVQPTFDVAAGHRYFASECFNRAWELIEKADRTAAEDETMILTAAASLWHWHERPDCTPKNLSVGHWQLARIYSILARGDDAMRHAEQSLKYAADLPPFYVAYAHEAIARAAIVQNNRSLAELHLTQADKLAASVSDPEDRAPLEADLRSLECTRRS